MSKLIYGLAISAFLAGILPGYAFEPVPLTHEKKIYKDEKTGNVYMHKTSGYLNFSNKDENGKQVSITGKNKKPEIEFMDDGEYEVVLLKKQEKKVSVKKRSKSKPRTKTVKTEMVRFSMYLDDTAPKSNVNFGTKNTVLNGKSLVFGAGVSAKIIGSDSGKGPRSGVSSYYYSLNGADYSEYKSPLSLTDEGSYEFRYYAVDNVGNAEKPNLTRVQIDKTAPVSSLSYDRFAFEDKYFSELSNLSLRATDDAAGVRDIFYKIGDGKYAKYNGKIKTDGLPEGKNSLTYYAVDRVGNKEAEKNFTLNMDKTAPVVTMELQGPSHREGKNVYITKDTRISLTGQDSASGFKEIYYNLNDDVNWAVYFEPVEIRDSVRYQKINYWASDNVYNKTRTESQSIILDNDLPSATLKITTDFYKNDNTYYVSGKTAIDLVTEDKTSGVKNFEYSLDNAPYESTKPIRITTEGEHSLRVRVTDNVGIENSANFSIIVDTGSPQTDYSLSIGQIGTEDALSVYPPKTLIYLSATDKESGIRNVYYSVNGGEYTVYSTPIVAEKSGRYKINILAKDRVGNTSAVKTVEFVIK